MLDRRDPDYWSTIAARKAHLDDHLRTGAIGESTYLLSLQIWRYTAEEQRQELEFRRMEIADGLAVRRGHGAVRHAERFIDSRRDHRGIGR